MKKAQRNQLHIAKLPATISTFLEGWEGVCCKDNELLTWKDSSSASTLERLPVSQSSLSLHHSDKRKNSNYRHARETKNSS